MISSFRQSLNRLVEYIGDPKDRGTILYCTILSIIATGVFYTIPYICGQLLNHLVKMSGDYEFDYEFIVTLCSILILIVMFWYVATSECAKRMTILSLDTTKRMRIGLHNKMLKVPVTYLDSMPPGDLTARFTNDLPAVGKLISADSVGFVVYNTMIAAILVMMLVTSPYLGLLYLVLLPVTLTVGQRITAASEDGMAEQRRRISDLNSRMSDIITSHRTIKNEVLGKNVLSEFEKSEEEFTDAYVSTKIRSAMIGPVTAIAANLGYMLTVVIGSMLIIEGMLSIGMFMSFMIYVRIVTTPLSRATEVFSSIRDESISLDRVLEVLEAPEEENLDEGKEEVEINGDIAFENVDFSYSEGRKALDSLSFTSKAGEITALVGPTGSGKTTVANLLMGFYKAETGRITIDGKDINEISHANLRNQTSAVLQTPWIFDGTVRENVVYNNPDVDEETIMRYSKLTGLDDYVQSLPDGYETRIGTDLMMLPLAQCRMVALTRAFINNPKIMILDEAVAGMDPITGQSILDGLKNEIKGRTVILITHNPALIKQADRVVRIEEGRCTGITIRQ